MLAQQYPQLWRWIDWPDRGGKPETGIDLVAWTPAANTPQSSAKFYEPTHALAKADIYFEIPTRSAVNR